jgi:aminopeptidase YwaD
MDSSALREKADAYLRYLCVDISSRRVGSRGNQAATRFFADTVSSFGFQVASPEFRCIDWSQDGVDLTAGDTAFEAFASPYSLGCQVSAPLVTASTVEELDSADARASILMLRGEIAKEQLMPKNFTFYNPESHKQIIRLLEMKQPCAIIAATAQDLQMVGGMYPFPLFEDGDFDIPSVYMTDMEGGRLALHSGAALTLESRAHRIPSSGCNVIARKGSGPGRVVLFAHIDARIGTPGANDNASGVIVLLLLAELLAGYGSGPEIELVAMNGEDYYSNPGEQQYLELNAGKFDDIILGINLDDVGYHKGRVAYSLYGCPPEQEGMIHDAFSSQADLVEGESWYAGDHGLFLMNSRPAIAITSELLAELMAEYTHTPKDGPEIVDTDKLVMLATELHDLLMRVDPMPARAKTCFV